LAIAPVLDFEIRPIHPRLTLELGRPALLLPGDELPSVGVFARHGGLLAGQLLRNGAVVKDLPPEQLEPAGVAYLRLDGTAEDRSVYEVRVRLESPDGRTLHHAAHFAVLPSA